MCVILSLGLMIALLIQTTTPIIYYVIPEDNDVTTNNDTHTLKHYVNNPEKYFISNTQLEFLAGAHHIYNDLVVEHVTNFSIVGSNMTVVYSQSAIIILNHVDNITISNISIKHKFSTNLLLLPVSSCSNISIQDSVFTCHSKDCRLMISNAFGVVTLNNVISDSLILWYNHSRGHCNTTVCKYTGLNTDNETYAIRIELHQHGYKIKIVLSEIKVKLNRAIAIQSTTIRGNNYIKTTFTGVLSNNAHIIYVWIQNSCKKFNNRLANTIHFDTCYFFEIITESSILINIFASQEAFLSQYSVISITNCMFSEIKALGILSALAQ